jgi:glycosyltransferase involved in cell wall biosynthesis
MRILTLCYEYPPLGGGGAKVVFGLSRELARLGHEIDIVTMGYGTLERQERSGGITVHRLRPIRRDNIVCHTSEMVRHELRAFPFALRLVRQNHYDLNHSHFIFPDGLCALALRKVAGLPYILTAHGSDVPSYNPDRFINQHKILAPAWQAVVRGARRIVCPSEHLRSLILAQRQTARTCTIPNGLDPGKFNAERDKEPRILVVTRMLRRKGVQKLLKAVANMDLPYEIHIVGDGPYLPRLRELAVGSSTRVKFWGWLDNDSKELRDLYETSRIFVFLSSVENFPINLLEAMAAGMAIVTNPETGCGEVVGDCALKVNPDEPEDIRSSLMKLITDPDLCDALGRRARQRFEQHFTWRTIAAQHDKLYRELTAG